MKAHHKAWLSVHPERDEVWLQARLADGFDVHHLDGNHSNNAPLNLVLIECADHMMLHNTKTRMTRIGQRKGPRGPQRKTIERAAIKAEREQISAFAVEVRAHEPSILPERLPNGMLTRMVAFR